METTDPKAERGAGWLPSLLAIAAPAAYLLLWSSFNGSDGCGPPGHSTAGHLLTASVFALPLLATGIIVAVGWRRGWRRRTVVWAAASVLVIGGMLEVFVLLFELGAHHCTE